MPRKRKDLQPGEFEVPTSRVYKFKTGWGVVVEISWDEVKNIDDIIKDIDVEVVEINRNKVQVIGREPCIKVGTDFLVPVVNFKNVDDLVVDDSHDLRTRWFSSKEEAEDHARSVKYLWEHPNPWTAFCVTD